MEKGPFGSRRKSSINLNQSYHTNSALDDKLPPDLNNKGPDSYL